MQPMGTTRGIPTKMPPIDLMLPDTLSVATFANG